MHAHVRACTQKVAANIRKIIDICKFYARKMLKSSRIYSKPSPNLDGSWPFVSISAALLHPQSIPNPSPTQSRSALRPTSVRSYLSRP